MLSAFWILHTADLRLICRSFSVPFCSTSWSQNGQALNLGWALHTKKIYKRKALFKIIFSSVKTFFLAGWDWKLWFLLRDGHRVLFWPGIHWPSYSELLNLLIVHLLLQHNPQVEYQKKLTRVIDFRYWSWQGKPGRCFQTSPYQ